MMIKTITKWSQIVFGTKSQNNIYEIYPNKQSLLIIKIILFNFFHCSDWLFNAFAVYSTYLKEKKSLTTAETLFS